MSNQHMPGPWTVEIESEPLFDVRTGEKKEDFVTCWINADKSRIALVLERRLPFEANARLIAAAPDLYEACVAAKAYCEAIDKRFGLDPSVQRIPTPLELDTLHENFLEKSSIALAKAEGHRS